MKYIIIDDEYIAHDIIKGYCDLLPNMELMKHCYDAIEALEYLNHNTVDLIFLDLNMPKLKGFEFLKTLQAPPKVIVTTAYSEFAIEGYELNILDYLLKPFSFERFLKAINKVTNPIETHAKEIGKTDQTEKRIFLRADKKYIQVIVNDILFIEAAGNYTKVVTKNEAITVRQKISDLIHLLSSEDILQVHKSFAVATTYIRSIEGNRILIDGHTIPIGKLYKTNVIRLLE